jgi:hypothetical protein
MAARDIAAVEESIDALDELERAAVQPGGHRLLVHVEPPGDLLVLHALQTQQQRGPTFVAQPRQTFMNDGSQLRVDHDVKLAGRAIREFNQIVDRRKCFAAAARAGAVFPDNESQDTVQPPEQLRQRPRRRFGVRRQRVAEVVLDRRARRGVRQRSSNGFLCSGLRVARSHASGPCGERANDSLVLACRGWSCTRLWVWHGGSARSAYSVAPCSMPQPADAARAFRSPRPPDHENGETRTFLSPGCRSRRSAGRCRRAIRAQGNDKIVSK